MFILDKPKSETPTFLFIKITLRDGPFKASLECKVLPAHWDKKSRRIATKGVPREKVDDYRSINNLLQEIDKFIDACKREARYTGKHLARPVLEKKLDELLGRPVAGKGFFDTCSRIIDQMEAGSILTPTGQKYSPGTIKNYRQSFRCIKQAAPKLSWESVDMDFYRSFTKFCIDKDWSTNYIGQHIKNLKGIMDEGRVQELHSNLTYELEEFKTIGEETEDIALTEEEVKAIYNIVLPEGPLDRARDWFILDCYTGLRVSDIQLLQLRNIQEETITIVNEKTDTRVVIPQHHCVKEILKKWSGLPPKMTDQEINRYIKVVAEKAGLTDQVIYSLTKGGRRQDFYMQKCEMVSNHTARRTSITNMLEAGIPDHQVMQIHGIRKHATLMKYKKTKPEKNAQLLQGHSYYTGK